MKVGSVSAEILNQYFDNLETTLTGVPYDNKMNYDETNLSDDPGKRMVLE